MELTHQGYVANVSVKTTGNLKALANSARQKTRAVVHETVKNINSYIRLLNVATVLQTVGLFAYLLVAYIQGASAAAPSSTTPCTYSYTTTNTATVPPTVSTITNNCASIVADSWTVWMALNVFVLFLCKTLISQLIPRGKRDLEDGGSDIWTTRVWLIINLILSLSAAVVQIIHLIIISVRYSNCNANPECGTNPTAYAWFVVSDGVLTAGHCMFAIVIGLAALYHAGYVFWRIVHDHAKGNDKGRLLSGDTALGAKLSSMGIGYDQAMEAVSGDSTLSEYIQKTWNDVQQQSQQPLTQGSTAARASSVTHPSAVHRGVATFNAV